jgi:hypothetical protein
VLGGIVGAEEAAKVDISVLVLSTAEDPSVLLRHECVSRADVSSATSFSLARRSLSSFLHCRHDHQRMRHPRHHFFPRLLQRRHGHHRLVF